MTPATARQLALDVLATARPGDALAWERLDAALGRAPLPPTDRRLATQLVYGVLRRRGSLDALLRSLVTRPPHKVEPWLTEALPGSTLRSQCGSDRFICGGGGDLKAGIRSCRDVSS